MTFDEYFRQVVDKAVQLGYDINMVRCFSGDIKNHYENGLSVDECVELEF